MDKLFQIYAGKKDKLVHIEVFKYYGLSDTDIYAIKSFGLVYEARHDFFALTDIDVFNLLDKK